MYRFIIVDDDDIVCESICSTIDWETFQFEKPVVFSSDTDALEFIQAHGADVVMTNVRTETLDGLTLANQLRELVPQAAVVFYTESQEFADVYAAFKLGAIDYLLRPATQDQMTETIQKVLSYLNSWPDRTTTTVTEGWESIISMARKYIDDNLCNSIRLTTLAEYVHMNPTYFSRYFKLHTGQNLVEYVTNQRIRRALELMRDPTIKIYNVGYQVGYKNLQHFYKIFKKTTGMTPNEYRRQSCGIYEEPEGEINIKNYLHGRNTNDTEETDVCDDV